MSRLSFSRASLPVQAGRQKASRSCARQSEFETTCTCCRQPRYPCRQSSITERHDVLRPGMSCKLRPSGVDNINNSMCPSPVPRKNQFDLHPAAQTRYCACRTGILHRKTTLVPTLYEVSRFHIENMLLSVPYLQDCRAREVSN